MQRVRAFLRRWFQTVYLECDGCAYFTDQPYDAAGLRKHRKHEH